MEYICIGMYLEHYSIMKAFFLSFWKNFVIFFAFGVFGLVLAHKKAFSITANKELDLP
ncbi:hypothetical protein NP0148_01640 [Helicobacter pylori]